MEQNGDSPPKNTQKYSQLIFDRGKKEIQQRKKVINDNEILGHPHAKIKKILTQVLSYKKILNMEQKVKNKMNTLKLLKENLGNSQDLEHGDEYLDTITKAQFMNKKTEKLDFIKFQILCSVKTPL